MSQTNYTKYLDHFLHPDKELLISIYGITDIDNRWSIKKRNIKDHLIYFMERGEINFSLNGEPGRLTEDSILWVQPNVEQQFSYDNKSKKGRVYFLRFQLKKTNPIKLDEPYFLIKDFNYLKSHFYDLIIHANRKNSLQKIYLKSALAILLSDILQEPKKRSSFTDGLKRYQIKQILKYTNDHIQQKISPKNFSDLLIMNHDYFSRQFKKSFSQTPREFIKQARINKAISLLTESNLNISEIANTLQYQDIMQFSHQFKKVTGKSPNQFRKDIS
ncbi:MAG: hypothetical protein COA79_23635 [Planctomycetota bacterium]|nr:MAG: hypothetical protein COA79_23635 [Planctomycetota bacterium]